ncbi:hypothetical protein Taro_052450 [Colocasia esculenta]|uniref:Uncharacterized protein n=1 Tax=Colocasia esculenta TaxID=4460 RepID=A0A843XK34_COLES|nr:hypothetical protein [Colocasia esculenta]
MAKPVWRPVPKKVMSSKAPVRPPFNAKAANLHDEQTGFTSNFVLTEPSPNVRTTHHSLSSLEGESSVCDDTQISHVSPTNVVQEEAHHVFGKMPLQKSVPVPVTSEPLTAHPMVTELPHGQAHMTATSSGNVSNVSSAMEPIDSSAVNPAPDDADMPCADRTPTCAAPSASTHQQAAPFAPKVKGIPPSVLNAGALPWTTPRSADQQDPSTEATPSTPSVKGATPLGTPSGVEASASPSAPRLSFAEALRKKAKKSESDDDHTHEEGTEEDAQE